MTSNTNTPQNVPQYRVGKNGGICLGAQSTYFGPGALIPPSMLDARSLSRLLAQRAIVRDGEVAAPAPRETPPPVGIGDRSFQQSEGGSATPEQAGGGAAKAEADAMLKRIEAERAAGTVKPVEPVKEVAVVRAEGDVRPNQKAASGFTHDPDGLVALPIDELRRLVTEVDKDMEVDHLDEVELIGILSSEYVAPAQPQA